MCCTSLGKVIIARLCTWFAPLWMFETAFSMAMKENLLQKPSWLLPSGQETLDDWCRFLDVKVGYLISVSSNRNSRWMTEHGILCMSPDNVEIFYIFIHNCSECQWHFLPLPSHLISWNVSFSLFQVFNWPIYLYSQLQHCGLCMLHIIHISLKVNDIILKCTFSSCFFLCFFIAKN